MLAKSCKMARHFWVDHSEKWRNFFGGTPQKMTGTERVNLTSDLFFLPDIWLLSNQSISLRVNCITTIPCVYSVVLK